MVQTVPFRQVLGARLRELREQAGAPQRQIAGIARRWGVPWYTHTISQVESGQRHLTVEEWLLLPVIYSQALPNHPRAPFTYADLVPCTPERLSLSTHTFAYPSAIEQLVRHEGRATPDIEEGFDTPRRRQVLAYQQARKAMSPEIVSDLDRRVGRSLGVDPVLVCRAAHRLWGRPLEQERDERFRRDGLDRLPPDSQRAKLGHMTRKLITLELRAVLRRLHVEPREPKPIGRPKKGGRR